MLTFIFQVRQQAFQNSSLSQITKECIKKEGVSLQKSISQIVFLIDIDHNVICQATSNSFHGSIHPKERCHEWNRLQDAASEIALGNGAIRFQIKLLSVKRTNIPLVWYVSSISGQRSLQGHVLSHALSGGFKFNIFRCLRCLPAVHDLTPCAGGRRRKDLRIIGLDPDQTDQLGDFLGRVRRRRGTVGRCVSRRRR